MTVLELWNQALSAAQARGRLTSLDDYSPEHEVLTENYEGVVRAVQNAAWWESCRAHSRLAVLATAESVWADGQPEPGYAYAYALPSNTLRPWYMIDFSAFSQSYSLTHNRGILSSNTPEAILTYAVYQTSPALWTSLQQQATVFALAARIAGPLTGKRQLVHDNYELANNALREAQTASANSLGPTPKAAVPWFAARGYRATSPARFFYPFGELFSYGQ
jgi:hypothetical protein